MSTLLEDYDGDANGDVILSWVKSGLNQLDVTNYELVVRIAGRYKYFPISERSWMMDEKIPDFTPVQPQLKFDYEDEVWYIDTSFTIPDEFTIRNFETDVPE